MGTALGTPSTLAGVAELADALDSKSSDRKVVGVQVPPPVLLLSQTTLFTGPLAAQR